MTHGCVQEALSIHGHVEPRLHSLDGYDPQPHRDQVEESWKQTDGRTEVRRAVGVWTGSWCCSALTVVAVLVFGSSDASVRVHLQEETLLAEETRHDSFELRL